MCTFAGAKVCQFDALARDEYIFWLDVPMEDAFSMDVLDGFEELEHVGLDLMLVEVLVPHQALVEVLFHQLEY